MGIRRWIGWSAVVTLIAVMFTAAGGSGFSIGAERALMDSVKARSEARFEGGATPSLQEVVAPPAFGVVGVIVDVEDGVGMWWEAGEDGELLHIVDPTDRMAQVITVHLSMDVERLVFGEPPEPSRLIRLAFAVDAGTGLKTAVELFQDRRMFAVAVPAGELFSYDDGLYAVALDGGMLAWTETGRVLDFALAGDTIRASLGLDDVTTSELRRLYAG